MKKLIGIIMVIVVILSGILGYKVVYKVSPRDFITANTRVIYANEGINTKDFTPLLTLLEDDKRKGEISEELKNLKYISKLYIFSDKEFYELNEQSFVGVIDTGYWYFLILKDLGKYFDRLDDIYMLKKEVRDKYFSNLDKDIYLKPYKGVFIFSLGEKKLKDFIAKDGKYLYNKEIEDTLDTKRDNLFGTLIYNNSGTDFYGVNLLTSSATIKNNIITSEGEIVLDEKESEIFKSSKENRELLKYINKNTLYISVDDFSKLDRVIFNPLIIGGNIDAKAVLALWKNLLGIDIEEMLKEIDGEVLFDIFNNSFMIKLKENAPEIRRVVTMLKDESSAFYTKIPVEEKDGILIVGNLKPQESLSNLNIDEGTYLYGEIDFENLFKDKELKVKIQGKGKRIKSKTEISIEDFKEILKEY